MSEIEKMYKTIFGAFAPNCSLCAKLIDCEIFKNTHNCNKFECDYKRLFTAEKQLLLIKWLAETRPVHITLLLGKWTIEGMVRYGIKYDTFEDALSGYVNQIWKDLKPDEKQQVKGILEWEQS